MRSEAVRALAAALCWSGFMLCFGGATVTAFPGGVPNYFSGTNARVIGHAIADGVETDGFTSIHIYLNDELIESVVAPPGAYFATQVSISDMFASNHFGHGSEVKVQIKAVGDDGVVYESPAEYVPVHNYGHVFGRFDLEVEELTWMVGASEWLFGDETWHGVPIVQFRLAQMLYNTYENIGYGWTSNDYLGADFSQASVCYVNTHGFALGNETFFWSDQNDYWKYYPTDPNRHPLYDEWYITGTLDNGVYYVPILPKRIAANGTGLPPFNTGSPPINLAFVDGCAAGQLGQSYSEAYLYPGGNAYTGQGDFPENQAFCSYLIDVWIQATGPVAEEFWARLEEGRTLFEAREIALDAYAEVARAQGEEPPTNANQWMAIYGDQFTRLNGVYTGTTNGAWSAWHR